ncbi:MULTISPECIES: signal peptidase I [unclassified Frigoribacterium]|uniref:signal peptidase I n=1 Tax=unclassified Frigoribacterium TaxID=2627005 RepID=UPI000F489D99|nr:MULTISPECIES: signal peptidase I [unclassified Frigoribacterium]ROP78371.1 signal peptidase I [Frigoribacterium sp. PhB107]TDT66161.1 signal peptidase I [Frigoribacterium sp. PhB116]
MASSPGRARHDRPPVDHARRNARARFFAREVVLWAGALTGVVCLTAAALAVFAGVTPLIFRSGSMSPDIPTGALALARTVPAADVAVGDVVSVPRADGVRVTHRVVETDDAGGASRSLVLKGDANPVTDPDPIVVAEADRVFWSTPRLGEWVDQALAPGWVFVIGTLFGMLAMIGFRRPRAEDLAATAHEPAPADGGRAEEVRARHDDGPRHAAGRHRTSGTAGTAAVSTVVALALAASLAAVPPESTLAAFADTTRATGTATTGTLVGASTIGCTGGGLLGAPVLSWDVPTPLPAGGVEPPSWNVYRNGVTLPVATVTVKSYQVPAEILGVSAATYRVQGTAGTAPWSSPVSGTRTVNFGLLGVTCSTAT